MAIGTVSDQNLAWCAGKVTQSFPYFRIGQRQTLRLHLRHVQAQMDAPVCTTMTRAEIVVASTRQMRTVGQSSAPARACKTPLTSASSQLLTLAQPLKNGDIGDRGHTAQRPPQADLAQRPLADRIGQDQSAADRWHSVSRGVSPTHRSESAASSHPAGNCCCNACHCSPSSPDASLPFALWYTSFGPPLFVLVCFSLRDAALRC